MLLSIYETFLPAKKNAESTWIFCVFFIHCWLFLFDPDLALCQYHAHTMKVNWSSPLGGAGAGATTTTTTTTLTIKTSNNFHIIIGVFLMVFLEKPALKLYDQFAQMVQESQGSIQFLLDTDFYATLTRKLIYNNHPWSTNDNELQQLFSDNQYQHSYYYYNNSTTTTSTTTPPPKRNNHHTTSPTPPYVYIRPTYSNPSFFYYKHRHYSNGSSTKKDLSTKWNSVTSYSQYSVPYCLPSELWFHICRFIQDPNDFLVLSQTCKFFNTFMDEDLLWMDLYTRTTQEVYNEPSPSKISRASRYSSWFNFQEKVNARSMKFHYMKQLQIASAADASVPSPILEPLFGRVLIRSGPIQLTVSKQGKTKHRYLFLFTDIFVVAKMKKIPVGTTQHDKRHLIKLEDYFTYDLKRTRAFEPYRIFESNRERIIFCCFDQGQLCLIQANKELEYLQWVSDFKRLVQRGNEYSVLNNMSSLGENHVSTASSCHLCHQKASLMKRLYWCWSCGCVICASCTVVVPWHFQYGCVCTMCEVDIKFQLRRL